MLRIFTWKFLWAVAFFLWTAFLLTLSFYPITRNQIEQDISTFRWDYLEHFVFYFFFSGFYIIWRFNKEFKIPLTEISIFIAISLAITILTEYVQGFIPGRSYNIYDLLSNVAGLISGTGMFYFVFVRLILRKHLKTTGP